ncbi:MAG TPA: peptidoglycan-binding protein [bacterium]
MSQFAVAKFSELGSDFKTPKKNGKTAIVQFNPETLRVSYANQIQSPSSGAGSQSDGSASRQYVGAGTTKLSLQLWFDVNAPMPGTEAPVNDVRRLTQRVTDLMNPEPSGKDKDKYVPPAVRFQWGSFTFDGIIESLEESLEFFSGDGVPLRASVSLSMSQQKILYIEYKGPGLGKPRAAPGTQPLVQAVRGSTVQGMAEAAGQGDNWQAIAAANGIENPRQPAPGQLLSLAGSPMTSGGVLR